MWGPLQRCCVRLGRQRCLLVDCDWHECLELWRTRSFSNQNDGTLEANDQLTLGKQSRY